MADYPQPIAPTGHVEPVPRRIRATLGGETVFATAGALYHWEWPPYPQYLIPAADIAPGALNDVDEPFESEHGTAVKVALRERPEAGRRYLGGRLDGMVRFAWDALDAWFEEDEQVYVHPRNPFARVDAVRSSRHLRIELDGVLLAESGAPVMVFETGLPPRAYLDPAAVDFSRLRESETVTACPYKGRTSRWWSVRTDAGSYPDLAWSYAFPTSELQPIAGLVAFFDEKVDVVLDGERQARPVTPFSD